MPRQALEISRSHSHPDRPQHGSQQRGWHYPIVVFNI
jgi:hypothetical protein